MAEAQSNIEKGTQGEAYVRDVIEKASKFVGKTVRVFNHVILDFYSVYGKRTAEIDHIIVTDDKIIIGETKAANYVHTDYSEVPWTLLSGDTTDNPIVQNHYHKQVFCSCFGIPRERVITVEFLLEYSNCGLRSQYPNDYVLGKDNLLKGLCLLFSESKETLNFDELCKQLERIEAASVGRENEHEENLKEVREIEEKTRTRDKHYRFKRTDIAKCPLCDGFLVFRYKPWVKKKLGNINNTWNIALGCSNYPITGCNVFITPRKDGGQGFDDVEEIHIEDRMEWTMEERHVGSILDEHINLKKENERLKVDLQAERSRIQDKDNQIIDLRETNNHLRSDVNKANNRAKIAECECKRFKRLFGKLYVKR